MVDFELVDVSDGVVLDIRGPWSSAAERMITDGLAQGVVLNYARGFSGRHLSFLAGLPLKRVSLLARTIKDLTPVETLGETLEELSIEVAPGASLDVTRFPRLTKLAAPWALVSESIREAGTHLQDLYLGSYTEPNLQPLRNLGGLLSLRMKDRPQLQTFEGAENLTWLQSLGVHGVPYLRSAEGLDSSVLTELQIESAPRLGQLDDVARATAVEFLNLGDCGAIGSLEPLRGMKLLTTLYLYGTTNVLSSDLSPLLDLHRLQELRIANRTSYQPSVRAVKDQLGIS